MSSIARFREKKERGRGTEAHHWYCWPPTPAGPRVKKILKQQKQKKREERHKKLATTKMEEKAQLAALCSNIVRLHHCPKRWCGRSFKTLGGMQRHTSGCNQTDKAAGSSADIGHSIIASMRGALLQQQQTEIQQKRTDVSPSPPHPQVSTRI